MRLCLLFCSGNIEISILKLKMCHPPILGAKPKGENDEHV